MITSCCLGQCWWLLGSISVFMFTFAACGMGNRQTNSVWDKNEDILLVIAMLCLHIPKIQASPASREGLYCLDKDQQLVHREKKQREGWFADDLLFVESQNRWSRIGLRGIWRAAETNGSTGDSFYFSYLMLISNDMTLSNVILGQQKWFFAQEEWPNFVITQHALRAPGH